MSPRVDDSKITNRITGSFFASTFAGKTGMINEVNGDFLQWLRGFYYVARTGSISRAAAKMNRSQSSVSYQIQCLERQLNVPLFNRANNLLHITPQGLRLLDWAISAFELISELNATIACDPGELAGKVGISGSMPILEQDGIADLIMRFRKEHPKVQIQVRACRAPEAIEDLKNGISDFALLASTHKLERFMTTKLCSAPFILVTPKQHGFVLDRQPTRDQLQDLPFVTYQGNVQAEIHTPCLTREQLEGLTGRTVITVNQLQLVLQYISRGAGCAIMDLFSLQAFPGYKKKTAYYPLGHFLSDLQYYMVSRKHRPMSPAASALSQQILCLFQGETGD